MWRRRMRWLSLLSLLSAAPASSAWPTDPSTPLPVCTAAGDVLAPMLAPDGSGGFVALWLDFRLGFTNAGVYAQRVGADGTVQWTPDGVAVGDAAGGKLGNALLADGAGGAFLVWSTEPGSRPGAFLQRIDAAGNRLWSPSNGVAVNTLMGSERRPNLCSDGAGGIIVVWCQTPGGGAYELRAQRFDGAGAKQWIPGFLLDSIVVSTGVSSAMFQNLAPLAMRPDGVGGVFVAMTTSAGDIRVQHLSAAGLRLWGNDGAFACVEPSAQSNEQLVPDGLGGVVVVWGDGRAGSLQADIYAQRMDSSGAALWGASGKAVCDTLGYQINPLIVRDALGRFVVAWTDQRAGLGIPEIRVQRLDLAGNRLWAPGGRLACVAAGTRRDPAIAAGPDGRVMLAWPDARPGAPGTYAGCLDSTGAACWAPGGVAVGTAATSPNPYDVALLADGTGGAYVAWRDYRSNVSYDLYAAHVSADGTLGVATGVDAPRQSWGWTLSPPHPNPTAAGTALRFALPEAALAQLEIFDIAGRRVRRLAAGVWPSGWQEVAWDGCDDTGRGVAAGVYVARLSDGQRALTTRVIRLR
jgi:hypothetical protein